MQASGGKQRKVERCLPCGMHVLGSSHRTLTLGAFESSVRCKLKDRVVLNRHSADQSTGRYQPEPSVNAPPACQEVPISRARLANGLILD